jgi:Flp pilus assembly protein CpaB
VAADPLARRYWIAIGIVALAAGGLVSRANAAASAASERWGPGTPVLVVTEPVGAGERLAEALEVERWPQELVPAAALLEVDSDDRAATDLDPGTPVTAASLASPGDGIAERRLVAVPTGPDALPLEPGDRVEVWAAGGPTEAPGLEGTDEDRPAADGAPAPSPIATGRVDDVLDEQVVLAVTASAVPRLADALAAGPVLLAGLR